VPAPAGDGSAGCRSGLDRVDQSECVLFRYFRFQYHLKRKVAEIDQRSRSNQQAVLETKEEASELRGMTERLESGTEDLCGTTEELAETASDYGEFHEKLINCGAMKPTDANEGRPSIDPRVAALAAQYNSLRATMRSGPERTKRMTETAEQMRIDLRGVTDFDVAGHLSATGRGELLAAHAYLTANPGAQHLPGLVDVTVKEDKPFGQYWALKAIANQLTGGVELDDESRRKLVGLRTEFSTNTDRGRMLEKILARAR
jgi:hypothetical protein